MEDKTPLYIMAIVCIVAVVAIVSMITKNSSSNDNPNTYTGSGITANVVAEQAEPLDLNVLGRILVGLSSVGAFVYMYTKW